MGLFKSLGTPKHNPRAHEQLIESQAQLNNALSRGPKIAQMGEWFENRLQQNHFGSDAQITFTRRERRV